MSAADAKRSNRVHDTREAWLVAAVDLFRPMFDACGSPLPETVRVSIGFPVGNAKAIGQCWFEDASADKLRHIFISPALADTASKQGVLATLLHECAHAALPIKTGHRGPFAKLCTALGLQKPWTATTAGPELEKQLADIARKLGDFPHGALHRLKRMKEQKNRHIKIVCESGCDYHLRGSSAMLDRAIPDCPECGGLMVREDEMEDAMRRAG